MKLKFKQSIATAETTYNVGQVYDMKNIEQAQSFVDAKIAEKVENATPKVETVVQETKKIKQERKNKKEVGE